MRSWQTFLKLYAVDSLRQAAGKGAGGIRTFGKAYQTIQQGVSGLVKRL